MEDQKLAQIQAELMQELDNEAKLEKHFKQSSAEIATHLLAGKPCKVELDGAPFMFKYRLIGTKEQPVIYLLIVNMNLYKITPEKYIPFTAKAPVDSRYTMQENMAATVEAFLRHRSGKIKPEMIEQEENYGVNL